MRLVAIVHRTRRIFRAWLSSYCSRTGTSYNTAEAPDLVRSLLLHDLVQSPLDPASSQPQVGPTLVAPRVLVAPAGRGGKTLRKKPTLVIATTLDVPAKRMMTTRLGPWVASPRIIETGPKPPLPGFEPVSLAALTPRTSALGTRLRALKIRIIS